MGKDKLVFGITVLKGRLEPLVLLCAQGPAPLVTGLGIISSFARCARGIRQVHRVLELVNDNEQRIAPCPGIVVLSVLVAIGCCVNGCQGIGIPGIESVLNWGWEVRFASLNTSNGNTERSIIQIPALFVFMIS